MKKSTTNGRKRTTRKPSTPKRNAANSVNISQLTSFELSELSRRCLKRRKEINDKARADRQAAQKKAKLDKKAKLEAQLAEMG